MKKTVKQMQKEIELLQRDISLAQKNCKHPKKYITKKEFNWGVIDSVSPKSGTQVHCSLCDDTWNENEKY